MSRGGIVGVVVLGVGVALLATAIRGATADGVALGGPWLAPLVVTTGWVVAAAVYCVRPGAAPGGTRIAPGRPALLLAALVGYALALKYTAAGYILTTAVFFLVAARLLSTGPPRATLPRDGLVAVGLSLAIYLAFTRLLGISLPAGVLPV